METEKEKVSPDFGEGVNHVVAHIMRKFGYMPGMGLGKRGDGITEFPEFHMQNNRRGLGYTGENKGSFPKNIDTLNGNFVKEGDDFPYCGFPEPWMNQRSAKKEMGLEVFF